MTLTSVKEKLRYSVFNSWMDEEMVFGVTTGFTSIITVYVCQLDSVVPEDKYRRWTTMAFLWSDVLRLGAYMAVALAWSKKN